MGECLVVVCSAESYAGGFFGEGEVAGGVGDVGEFGRFKFQALCVFEGGLDFLVELFDAYDGAMNEICEDETAALWGIGGCERLLIAKESFVDFPANVCGLFGSKAGVAVVLDAVGDKEDDENDEEDGDGDARHFPQ